jgi:thioesterase domain-containing protein
MPRPGDDAERPPTPASTIEVINAGDASRRPLFCVHAQAGEVSLYHGLARHLAHAQPVLGLRAPDLAAGFTLEQLAGHHVREIAHAQPDGPYLILGECTGGALAYEIAVQLARGEQAIALLALVDSFAPGLPRLRWWMPRALYRIVHRARILNFHLRNLARLRGGARLDYVIAKLARARLAFQRKAPRPFDRTAARHSPQRDFDAALTRYRPARFDDSIVLFRAARLPLGIECHADMGWSKLVKDVQVEILPGYFTTPISEPHVRMLAERLSRHLTCASS